MRLGDGVLPPRLPIPRQVGEEVEIMGYRRGEGLRYPHFRNSLPLTLRFFVLQGVLEYTSQDIPWNKFVSKLRNQTDTLEDCCPLLG